MTSSKHLFNFSSGPAVLPAEVLEQAAAEMCDWHGTEQSVMEMSHRGEVYPSILESAERDLRTLLSIPSNYKVLFLQGGATLQFAMIPLNLIADHSCADYVDTGDWSKRAIQEAQSLISVHTCASNEAKGFIDIPPLNQWRLSKNPAYIHYVANETIRGVEFQSIPEVSDIPLVSDMSSNLLSRPIDVTRFGLIYAGAQKNVGPAGLTIVIIREDLLGHAHAGIPSMLDYKNHADKDSTFNTPPTYSIYIAGLVFQWLLRQGGILAIEQKNIEKSSALYDFLDSSTLFENRVNPSVRSRMNVVFTLKRPELNDAFLKQAREAGLIQLKGHRLAGGMRASIYNAMPIEGVVALINYMREFEANHVG